ncbi:MAG: Insertion element protein [Pseudonocardiales bacterium]|nr:Insertion element protein [Pseudonocardiales bacterium]MBV9031163.1 Insertion element protein [Pseudonocardiales bacterium]
MTEARAVPFYCPYCGEEDLRPATAPHAAWSCADCRRVFVVRLVGMAAVPTGQVAR